MDFLPMSDTHILEEIGTRLQRERLNRNLTQQQFAEKAGISRRTLQNAEKGDVTNLSTLIAILRGLDLLERFDQFLPPPPLSPLQLAKLKGQERKRASQKTDRTKSADKTWKWKE